MKKSISLILSLILFCLCFTACGVDDGAKITDADLNEATETVTEKEKIFIQPENALEIPVQGMTICYIDYIVDDNAFVDFVNTAVTPVIIQSPKDFSAFFETDEKPGEVAKGKVLFDEMTLTQEGKDIYRNPAFYDSWNLIILSVRENNAETKHEINSVSYNTDSCIFSVNGTRDVAEGEGEATVRHYVFRVPKNVYTGVSHSLKKTEK